MSEGVASTQRCGDTEISAEKALGGCFLAAEKGESRVAETKGRRDADEALSGR